MFDYAKKTNFRKKILISIFCVLIHCAAVDAASPKGDIKEGNRYYQNGEYTASREKYSEALKKAPESDIVNFNLGTAFYKEEDYEKAVDHLVKVLLSEDDELRESAQYNLGNALYRFGMMHVEDDINLAVSSLEESLSQYERALSFENGDEDAKYNHAYVQKELMRLKEQQKQQQQKQDQQQCDLPKDKKDQQRQDQRSQEEQEGQQKKQQEGRQDEQQQRQQDQQGESGQEEQNQSGQEEQSKEQQEKRKQGRGQEGEEDYNEQQESGARPQNAQELTQKEAQMLLENYQQVEEPQGLLNVYPRTNDARPVFRDW